MGNNGDNKLWDVSRGPKDKIVFTRNGTEGALDQPERIHHYEDHENKPTEGKNRSNPNGPIRTSPER